MRGMDELDDTVHLDEQRTRDESPISQPPSAPALDEAPTTRIVPVRQRPRSSQPRGEPRADPSPPLADLPPPWRPEPSVLSVRGALPVDPSAPTMPLAAGGAPALAAPRPPRPRERLALLGPPLPPSLAALVFGAALCGITAAGYTGWLFTQGEWATAARAVGLAALLMGILYLLASLARAVADSRFSRPVLLGLLAMLVLGALGDAGLTLVRPLHLAQAQALETSQDWTAAIRQYQLSGERAPTSRDLARLYLEWGDALRRQGDYASALDRYYVVLAFYPDAGTLPPRAEAATLQTYAAWLATGRPDIPYDALLSRLARDASAPWCRDAACQTAMSTLQPQARYQYGVTLAADGRYTIAIAQLEATTTRFPASSYAAQAHAAAASAYYALGQSQRASATCTDAIPTFQTLTTRYADTPQGAQAKAALAASVSVSGILSGYPRNPGPTMYLSRHTNRSDYFSDDYSATLDSSGHFTFKHVPPGSYNLSAAFADGRGVFWSNATTGNAYDVVVGPLCPLTLPTPYTWP